VVASQRTYNRINGTYACENGQELTGTLRDAWHFDGLVKRWAAAVRAETHRALLH